MRMRRIPRTEIDLPVVGQGTWGFGDVHQQRTRDVDALRLGIELGLTLIDTAEFYAGGGSERVVGEAIRDCRDQVFLVTKVWPSHAAPADLVRAVSASLRRLGTDRLDGLLLHWPTRSVPLQETIAAMEHLRESGAVRFYGVSNFSLPWLRRLEGAGSAAFNQVSYSLGQRRAENAVIPYAERQGQIVMAYSPLAHGRHEAWGQSDALRQVADRHGASPTEIALAWTVRHASVVTIPKAVRPEHIRSNARAGTIELGPDDIERLERAFPKASGDISVLLPPYRLPHRIILAGQRMAARKAVR